MHKTQTNPFSAARRPRRRPRSYSPTDRAAFFLAAVIIGIVIGCIFDHGLLMPSKLKIARAEGYRSGYSEASSATAEELAAARYEGAIDAISGRLIVKPSKVVTEWTIKRRNAAGSVFIATDDRPIPAPRGAE